MGEEEGDSIKFLSGYPGMNCGSFIWHPILHGAIRRKMKLNKTESFDTFKTSHPSQTDKPIMQQSCQGGEG